MPTYIELLKDPRWQRKRLEILQRDGWMCLNCADTEKTLHVHHRYYRTGKKPWEYDDDCYRTLCVDCHDVETDLKRRLERAILALDSSSLVFALLGFAEALHAVDGSRSRADGKLTVDSYEHGAGVAAAIVSSVRPFLALVDHVTLVASENDYVVDARKLREEFPALFEFRKRDGET